MFDVSRSSQPMEIVDIGVTITLVLLPSILDVSFPVRAWPVKVSTHSGFPPTATSISRSVVSGTVMSKVPSLLVVPVLLAAS